MVVVPLLSRCRCTRPSPLISPAVFAPGDAALSGCLRCHDEQPAAPAVPVLGVDEPPAPVVPVLGVDEQPAPVVPALGVDEQPAAPAVPVLGVDEPQNSHASTCPLENAAQASPFIPPPALHEADLGAPARNLRHPWRAIEECNTLQDTDFLSALSIGHRATLPRSRRRSSGRYSAEVERCASSKGGRRRNWCVADAFARNSLRLPSPKPIPTKPI
jgi:hypothetical protein